MKNLWKDALACTNLKTPCCIFQTRTDIGRRLTAMLASTNSHLNSDSKIVTFHKRKHHISLYSSVQAEQVSAAWLHRCSYRCSIHSCLKSLTPAWEQPAARWLNTWQPVNVSVQLLVRNNGGHKYMRCRSNWHPWLVISIQRINSSLLFGLFALYFRVIHCFYCCFCLTLLCFFYRFFQWVSTHFMGTNSNALNDKHPDTYSVLFWS